MTFKELQAKLLTEKDPNKFKESLVNFSQYIQKISGKDPIALIQTV